MGRENLIEQNLETFGLGIAVLVAPGLKPVQVLNIEPQCVALAGLAVIVAFRAYDS